MRKTIITTVYALAMTALPAMAQFAAAPAFPGAEGYGRYTSGGRGGQVLHVTNLQDYCDNIDYSADRKKEEPIEGSLRWAVEQTGPRTIVFDVAGTIELKCPLKINNPDVSILGQTSPGDGICLKNHNVNINTSNVIMRFMRFRMGDEGKRYYKKGEALQGKEQMIEDDALNSFHKTGDEQHNVIIDHCSLSWSVDECGSFYGNENFTLQWCILSESLRNSGHPKGAHGYCGIWGGKNASFHHNLLANHDSRNPRFDHGYVNTMAGPVDFTNNVIYNWGQKSAYGGETFMDAQQKQFNMINNYYLAGPYTKTCQSKSTEIILNPTTQCSNCNKEDKTQVKPGKFYLSGNMINGNVASDNGKNFKFDKNGSIGTFMMQSLATQPAISHDMDFAAYATVTTQDADKAFELVKRLAGASLVRDAVDTRVINDMTNGKASFKGSNGSTGGIIDSPKDVGGWPELKGEKLQDTDNDGIPDEWEKAHGLNPEVNDANELSLDPNKIYTNIEVYANSLVEKIMKAGKAFTAPGYKEYFPKI